MRRKCRGGHRNLFLLYKMFIMGNRTLYIYIIAGEGLKEKVGVKIDNNTLEQVWSNAIQATTGIARLSYFFQIWIYIYVVCTDLITRQVGICIIIQFPDGLLHV